MCDRVTSLRCTPDRGGVHSSSVQDDRLTSLPKRQMCPSRVSNLDKIIFHVPRLVLMNLDQERSCGPNLETRLLYTAPGKSPLFTKDWTNPVGLSDAQVQDKSSLGTPSRKGVRLKKQRLGHTYGTCGSRLFNESYIKHFNSMTLSSVPPSVFLMVFREGVQP